MSISIPPQPHASKVVRVNPLPAPKYCYPLDKQAITTGEAEDHAETTRGGSFRVRHGRQSLRPAPGEWRVEALKVLFAYVDVREYARAE
jgi:hypothetical protein